MAPRTPPTPLPMPLELWRLAWPAITRNILNCVSDRMTLTLVGHYDSNTANFDGAGLGKMLSNVTGLSIGLGLNLGLATCCSQSHGRGTSAVDNPINLRRCGAALSVALTFTVVVAVFAERILGGVGLSHDVARASARFAQVQTIGVPFLWVGAALQTVCDGLQQTKPGLYSMVIASVLQLILTVVLIVGFHMGYLGMAAGRTIGSVAQCLTMIFLIKRSPNLADHVWGKTSPSWSVIRSRVINPRAVIGFVLLALPSAVVWWIEWWAFEGLTVLVGLLPNATPTLAAHGIIFNSTVTLYQVFQGIGTALCAAIGTRIGSGRGAEAPKLIRLCFLATICIALLLCCGMYFFRRDVGFAFSDDKEVVGYVDGNMLGAVLSIPGYGVLMTLAGACRGADRQRWVAIATISGYAAGVPLAWYFGKKKEWPHPLMGVWLGNATALAWAALWTVVLVTCGIRWSSISIGKVSSLDAMVSDRQKRVGSVVPAAIYESDKPLLNAVYE